MTAVNYTATHRRFNQLWYIRHSSFLAFEAGPQEVGPNLRCSKITSVLIVFTYGFGSRPSKILILAIADVVHALHSLSIPSSNPSPLRILFEAYIPSTVF